MALSTGRGSVNAPVKRFSFLPCATVGERDGSSLPYALRVEPGLSERDDTLDHAELRVVMLHLLPPCHLFLFWLGRLRRSKCAQVVRINHNGAKRDCKTSVSDNGARTDCWLGWMNAEGIPKTWVTDAGA